MVDVWNVKIQAGMRLAKCPSPVYGNMKTHRMITIASFPDLPSAYLARSLLEASGIPCFLANEYLIGVQWGYAPAVGGVELAVHEQNRQEALALLAENDARLALVEMRCSVCGGAYIASQDMGKALLLVSLLLFDLPLPYPRRRMRCLTCGHTWHTARDN